MEDIPAELATLSTDEHRESGNMGLVEVQKEERQELIWMLDRVLSIETGYIGFTPLFDHNISVETTRPIQQKYSPVSRRIMKKMHEHVLKMLTAEIIEPSSSSCSISVVMVHQNCGSMAAAKPITTFAIPGMGFF